LNKITDISSLSKDFIQKLFSKTSEIKSQWPNISKTNNNKTVCLLFWEPSTRTKLSFEHAAKKLGFTVIDFSPEHSSIQKGESFEDTIKTLLALKVDGFIVRHPEDKIINKIATWLPDDVFLINAGDGNHAHPTQAMLDVYTMQENYESFDNLAVTILGDAKHSRVIPSYIELLKIMGCSDISFLAPKELLTEKYAPAYYDINDGCLAKKNILYVLRIQKERFSSSEQINEQDFINKFQVNEKFLSKTKFAGKLMHPGPINIGMEIDMITANSNHSLILDQVENGLYIRAALLSLVS